MSDTIEKQQHAVLRQDCCSSFLNRDPHSHGKFSFVCRGQFNCKS